MKRMLLTLLAVSLSVAMLWGCGSNRSSDGAVTGGDDTLASAETLGITNCLNCHNVDTTVTDGWLGSRHGNDLLVADKEALNAQGANPVHEDDDEDGLGEGLPNYDHGDTCFTCHDALADGRRIDEALAGENERPVISCESCHGGGQFHNGIAAGIPFPTPGPEQCGQCHGVTEVLFHSSSDDGANVRRNITDSHDDDATTADVVEGYVVKESEQTGCVDCHYSAHDFDLTINNEWAESGHAGHIKTLKDAELQAQRDALALIPDPTREQRAAVLTAVKAEAVTGEAFIHDADTNGWDNTAEDASCQRCHTATGGKNFLDDPDAYDPADNDFSHLSGWTASTGSPETELIYCWTCHSDSQATLRDPGGIPFPSGAELSLTDDGSNICMACHQGRASGESIVDATPNDVVQAPDYDSFNFINRHYFAAAAILFGTDATAGFEYAGRIYLGQNEFTAHADAAIDKETCVQCHLRGEEDHGFEPELADCSACHDNSGGGALSDFDNLGLPFGGPDVDYDGDAVGESFQAEIDGFAGDGVSVPAGSLLTAIQAYATGTLGASVVYVPGSYPYWFNDNGTGGGVADNGVADGGEASYPNRYLNFDRTLLQAAFNFHSAQDPCGDIHNYKYVIQTLYDSLDDLDDGLQNNSVTGTRP